ncbi:MAG TPA: hypothetical protein VG797_01215 [Phycisphaerales bacterium]|nr:hypothetical protein [Phycisphaerales bacterium]
MQMTDFLCDFCRGVWVEGLPMVEGHQGSLICGKCLTVAYAEIVNQAKPSAPEGYTCIMCLEERPDPGWRSPLHDEAMICARCIRQAAGALVKDKDSGWKKPGA